MLMSPIYEEECFSLYSDNLVRYGANIPINLITMILIILGGIGFLSIKKIITVIGLAKFGWHLALSISEEGGEVIAIDEKQHRINMIKAYVSKAIVADIREQQAFSADVPKDIEGKTLAELDLRTKYALSVIAVRELVPNKMIICSPTDFKLKMSDILIVLGIRENIEKFAKGELTIKY